MGERALVTGGAGFIGSHLVDALVARGDRVRILDDLDAQAHPAGAPDVPDGVELVVGDLRDRDTVARAVVDVDVVYHQGGMVGNGQSMLEARRYVDVNSVGTATLLEALRARPRGRALRRLVVASSMAVYGDGAYRCAAHGTVSGVRRPAERLSERRWEPLCPSCEREVEAIATSEDHATRPISVYGVTKRDQEELCLVFGRAHGIPTIALRYLNTYGSRQALGNPYTGVLAIMATRILAGRRPLVFEDGLQKRDLVHVSDVVRANLAATDAPDRALYRPYNVGTGKSATVEDLARALARALGRDVSPDVPGDYRAGDIRHCFADVSRARELLDWEAKVDLDQGLRELCAWAARQEAVDRTDEANAELRAMGVIKGT